MSSRTESPAVPVTTFANLVMFGILVAAGWHFLNLDTRPKQSVVSPGSEDEDEFSRTDEEIRAMLWKAEANALDRNRAIENWAKLGAVAVPTLEAALHSPDPTIRRSAATALGLMGPEARDAASAVRQLLADRDIAIQHAAITALLVIDADLEPSIPDFVRFVDQKDIRLRNAAASCLTTIGPVCVTAVLPLAAAENPDVRQQAIMILDRVGYGDPRVEPVLRKLLGDEDLNVHRDAFQALLERGNLTHPEILAALEGSNLGLARLGLRAVAARGADGAFAVSRLKELFETADPALHEQILATCERIGPPASFALPILQARLAEFGSTQRQIQRRRDAVEMLGRIGAGEPAIARKLLELLDDAHPAVVQSAGRALRRHGGQSAEAATALLTARLEDRDADVRRCALAGLQGLGPAAGSSVRKLILRLLAVPPEEAVEIAAVLGEMGPLASDAVPPLLQLLQRRMTLHDHGWQVVRTLGQIGIGAEAAVPALSDVIRESTPLLTMYDNEFRMQQASRLVLETARTLGQLGPNASHAAPALLPLLDRDVAGYDDYRRREYVLAFLPAIVQNDAEAEAAAAAVVLELLYDENPHLRAMAAEALGALNRGRSLDVIAELMSSLNDPSPYVRTAAALALGRQGASARSAVPALEELLRERRNAWRNRHTPRGRETEEWNLNLYAGWNRISVHDAASQALQAIDPVRL